MPAVYWPFPLHNPGMLMSSKNKVLYVSHYKPHLTAKPSASADSYSIWYRNVSLTGLCLEKYRRDLNTSTNHKWQQMAEWSSKYRHIPVSFVFTRSRIVPQSRAQHNSSSCGTQFCRTGSSLDMRGIQLAQLWCEYYGLLHSIHSCATWSS